MLSPFNPGTLLNQRYRVVRILGQSDYGRTYLAQDEGRFNELCTLKEIPLDPDISQEKLTELRERFHQVVSKLYRLQHPQAIQVQATFEEDKRLFVVFAYIEGKTLQELLALRRDRDKVFEEAEVRSLLMQSLPGLDYLHRSRVIHGNLAPENIVLPHGFALNRDRSVTEEEGHKPILINFGAIADFARGLRSPSEDPQTPAAKPGYLPPEPEPTEELDPTRDLYALAATAVVLLTGKDPQELYDPIFQTWQWQSDARVSLTLSEVLTKMLSPQPRDRYPSAAEVLRAFQPSPTPQNEPSQAATVAVERPPEAASPPAKESQRRASEAYIPEPGSESVFDNPWTLAILTLLLAAIAGIGAWGLVTILFKPRSAQIPQPEATESIFASPTPTETPTPTPQPQGSEQRITLLPGESFSDSDRLRNGAVANYIIPGQPDLQLQVTLESTGVVFDILRPDGEIIAPNGSGVKEWEGLLPIAGDYTIQLLPLPGLSEDDYQYQLNLRLTEPTAPSPSPTAEDASPFPTPSPSPDPALSPSPTPTVTPPEPNYDRQLILVPPNLEDPVEIQGRTSPETTKRYLVDLQAGQVLKASVQEGRVTLDIRSPDGQTLENAGGVQLWEGQVLREGQYQIDVLGDRDRDFTLTLSVRDTESNEEGNP